MKLGPASKRLQRFRNLLRRLSAHRDLVCYKKLTDHVILAQVNIAIEEKPEEEDENIAGQIVPAVEADAHLITL